MMLIDREGAITLTWASGLNFAGKVDIPGSSLILRTTASQFSDDDLTLTSPFEEAMNELPPANKAG